jgi:hypothetical protein
MKMERIRVLERESKILHELARKHRPDSNEYKAIEHAAFALHYALSEAYEGFRAFVRDSAKELSAEQKAHLAELGLDPE